MAAEGPRRYLGIGRDTCVNGAATGWPRKVHKHDAMLAAFDGVNGAATGWPRKAAGSGCGSGRPPRVNGAATGWPRKALCRTVWTPPLHASMGPRPDGRGRKGALDLILPVGQRQWGRDRMAAEG